MNKTANIIVVGAGMAGLSAALVAAQAGKSVTLLTAGAGALSIGSGCIDVLGYVDGKTVRGDPLDSIAALPPEHPYRIMGRESVREALQFFGTLCQQNHWPLLPTNQQNNSLPTIMGTLKPTYLCPPSANGASLANAHSVAVLGIEGIKDCQPDLIIKQLQSYTHLADKKYSSLMLPSPFGKTHRNISPLDVARHLDTPEGLSSVIHRLTALKIRADVLLLPPICGTHAQSMVWESLHRALGCAVVEMLSIPPGVGGLRVRELFLHALRGYPVTIVENTRVLSAQVHQGQCVSLKARCIKEYQDYSAKAFIIATGGFLGEGLRASPGCAQESIFHLAIDSPTHVEDWSKPDIFGQHAFARMGVHVNTRMLPLNTEGAEILRNVHFAGRILGGYDFASEKSGNGVALATGWHAAKQVLTYV
ncbi:MAG: anaerobic glycerol-3-phosphate dehydrogenase subunit GlpB [Desulfovibrionaceae bacterium]